MASSPTSRLAFRSEEGEPLAAPGEWSQCLVEVECEGAGWREPRLRCNGVPIPLFLADVAGRDRVLGRWPRSAAGHYELELDWEDGSWEETTVCTVKPEKLDLDAVEAMLADLNGRLPASIAIALRRAGALAGVEIVPPAETTLAEEVNRLRRAVKGTETRAGLAKILHVLAEGHHRVLQPLERWVGRHQARRIDPVRFALALGRGSNLASDGLPIAVPERPVAPSPDIYENRLLKSFHEQVNVRLRIVIMRRRSYA